jgi:hypothetical protein
MHEAALRILVRLAGELLQADPERASGASGQRGRSGLVPSLDLSDQGLGAWDALSELELCQAASLARFGDALPDPFSRSIVRVRHDGNPSRLDTSKVPLAARGEWRSAFISWWGLLLSAAHHASRIPRGRHCSRTMSPFSSHCRSW